MITIFFFDYDFVFFDFVVVVVVVVVFFFLPELSIMHRYSFWVSATMFYLAACSPFWGLKSRSECFPATPGRREFFFHWRWCFSVLDVAYTCSKSNYMDYMTTHWFLRDFGRCSEVPYIFHLGTRCLEQIQKNIDDWDTGTLFFFLSWYAPKESWTPFAPRSGESHAFTTCGRPQPLAQSARACYSDFEALCNPVFEGQQGSKRQIDGWLNSYIFKDQLALPLGPVGWEVSSGSLPLVWWLSDQRWRLWGLEFWVCKLVSNSIWVEVLSQPKFH